MSSISSKDNASQGSGFFYLASSLCSLALCWLTLGGLSLSWALGCLALCWLASLSLLCHNIFVPPPELDRKFCEKFSEARATR